EQANAGVLTNFDVFDFLRARGATSDPMGCLGAVAPSECKCIQVFEYLHQSPACTQTRESIDEFLERCEKFKLSPVEKLNIINLRPSNQPEIYALVKECGKRLVKGDIDEVPELLELVNEVLPQPPPKPEAAAEQHE
ncbi:DNA-directed RNA polymerase III subunit RPC9, partial [Ananas comosus]